MRNITKTLLATTAVAVMGVSVSACATTADPHPATTAAQHKADAAPEAEKAEKSKETPGQENARRSAEDYLNYTAFSKKGLIQQLEAEDFNHADAAYAASAVHANWKVQAAKSAKDYLDYSGFSRQGLIDQLRAEGYTPQQAAFGVTKAGL